MGHWNNVRPQEIIRAPNHIILRYWLSGLTQRNPVVVGAVDLEARYTFALHRYSTSLAYFPDFLRVGECAAVCPWKKMHNSLQ
jgi:hypothetical protein